MRAGPSVLRRLAAARPAPPAPAGRGIRSGRCATARVPPSSTCRPPCTSRPTAAPASAAATTTQGSTSAGPGPRSRRRDARAVPRHVRAGRAETHGDQGSAAKWAHAAMALAVRALGRGSDGAPPDPAAVLAIAERIVSEGDARGGPIGGDLGRGRAGAAARLARLDRPRPDRRRAARAGCDRTASRTPTSSGGRVAGTSESCTRRSRARSERRARGGRRAPSRRARPGRRAERALRRMPPRRALRAGDRVPRAREAEAAGPRGEPVRVALWPTASAACTA